MHKLELVSYDTIIPHVPAEVLSQSPSDDCFDSLRAHFKDIAAGSEEVSDQHRLMKRFANEIGDILWTVADTLRPRDFDEFLKYGFSDRPPDAP